MNIDNLHVGQIVKNYKELCKVLEVEPRKDGNSKNSHINELRRHFAFAKAERGNSLTILEIYNLPKEKIDKREEGNYTNAYIKDGELLLIDLLLCAKNGELTLPTTSLLLALNMVNKNYSKYYGNLRPVLSENLNIEIEYIHDYFNTVGSSLSGSVETIIKRLRRKKLIHYTEVTMIKEMMLDVNYTEDGKIKLERKIEYGKNGEELKRYMAPKMEIKGIYREATKEELKKITKIEREEFINLGFSENDSKNILYKNGSIHKYRKNVERRLFDEMNFSRVYIAHRMLFNEEHLEDEKFSILQDIEKELIEDGINSAVIENIMSNAKKRSNSAIKSIEESVDFGEIKGKVSDKTIRRADSKYLEYYHILNCLLINDGISSDKEYEIFNSRNTEKINIDLPLDM